MNAHCELTLLLDEATTMVLDSDADLDDCLARGGLGGVRGLVLRKCRAPRDAGEKLRARGFVHLMRFIPLPPNKPRLYLRDDPAVLRYLSPFYIPVKRIPRLALLCLIAAATRNQFAWLARALFRKRALIATQAGGQAKSLAELDSGQKFSHSLDIVALYLGNNKRVALLAHAKTKERLIAKYPTNLAGATSLRNEAVALRSLSLTPVSASVPVFISVTNFQQRRIFLQTAAPTEFGQRDLRLTQRHYEFLSTLSTVNRKSVLLENSAVWSRIARFARDNVGVASDAFIEVKSSLARETAKPVPLHMTHGDFSPWNIFGAKHGIFVIDWEHSENHGLALSDLFSFQLRTSKVLSTRTCCRLKFERLIRSAHPVQESLGLRQRQVAILLRVWWLDEYLRRPELRSCLEKMVEGGIA